MISKFKKTSHTRGAGAMLLLAVLACFILTNAYVAKADFEFAEPVNIQRIIPVLQPGYDFISCLSYDGLEMYIYSGQGFDTNLRVLRRESEDDDWVPQEDLELSSTLPMTTAHPFLPMDLRSTSARTGLGATVAGIST